MAASSKRTEVICSAQVEQLRRIKGWSLETLAAASSINIRTLRRKITGEPAYWSTIARIAEALGVSPERLLIESGDRVQRTLHAPEIHFGLNLQLTGELRTPEQLSCIASLTTEVLARLASAGITIRTSDSTLTVADPRDQVGRVITLVYGRVNDVTPYWVYVAVKPSRYRLFLQMHTERKLDLYSFDQNGEIIVCGEGPEPDDEVTRQVAKMYGCDLDTWMTPTDIEAEVARRLLDRSSI